MARRASRDTDAVGPVGEISAIYLSPAHWSTRIDLKLWLTARARLIEWGFETVSLWVFADNARAIGFYRAAGSTDPGVLDWPAARLKQPFHI